MRKFSRACVFLVQAPFPAYIGEMDFDHRPLLVFAFCFQRNSLIHSDWARRAPAVAISRYFHWSLLLTAGSTFVHLNPRRLLSGRDDQSQIGSNRTFQRRAQIDSKPSAARYCLLLSSSIVRAERVFKAISCDTGTIAKHGSKHLTANRSCFQVGSWLINPLVHCKHHSLLNGARRECTFADFRYGFVVAAKPRASAAFSCRI
jgi:hypothetical protein